MFVRFQFTWIWNVSSSAAETIARFRVRLNTTRVRAWIKIVPFLVRLVFLNWPQSEHHVYNIIGTANNFLMILFNLVLIWRKCYISAFVYLKNWFFYGIGGKWTDVSPDGKWLPPTMDTSILKWYFAISKIKTLTGRR